ncbi:MAG TPA: hypothetical protein VHV31_15805, partial [Nitrolancea sp.]|nr:hypothetical protein [Nitrolancea sp.]
MATVLSFVFLVILTLIVSAWAHLAQDHRILRIALVILTATISSVVLLVGVVSAVADLRGASGSISLSTALLIGVALAIGLPLIRPIRLALAKVMPFDPDSP